MLTIQGSKGHIMRPIIPSPGLASLLWLSINQPLAVHQPELLNHQFCEFILLFPQLYANLWAPKR